MGRLAKENILDLSISERIQLVEDIWDSIASVPESIQLTDERSALSRLSARKSWLNRTLGG